MGLAPWADILSILYLRIVVVTDHKLTEHAYIDFSWNRYIPGGSHHRLPMSGVYLFRS